MKTQKRRRPYKRRPKEKANSVGEAVEKMLIEKKISHKINYDVLRNLNKENELERPSKCEPETPSTEPVTNFLQSVQPSIPVRYTGRKRDASSLPRLPVKKVKFLETSLETSPVNESSSVTSTAPSNSMVVESGPVQYDDNEHEDMDDGDDEDDHLSAAQLLGHQFGEGSIDEYEDFESY